MSTLTTSSKRKRQDNEDGDKDAQPSTKFLITIEKPIPAINTSNIPVYACKQCDKEFSTFQALGGHRASHKKRNKILAGLASENVSKESHTCSICFQKFDTGQALGGHMRKHNNTTKEKTKPDLLEHKTVLEHDWASKSDSISWENFVGEGTRCNGSTLVTRDLFPMEPIWAEDMPMEIISVLPKSVERSNSWLELKLGHPGKNYK